MYTVGGATKALLELVLKLKENGHEPIVCTSVHNDFNALLDLHNITNLPIGHFCVMDSIAPRDPLRLIKYLYKKMKYLLSRNNAVRVIENEVDLKSIDVIHTNSIRNDIGCMLFRKYGIPHVMHVREFGQEDFSCAVFRPNYYQYLNNSCSVLLAVSDAVRKSLIRKGINEGIIRTLYDGVDFSDFIVKENYQNADELLKLVIVGGICETKGQQIAVKALSFIPDNIREKVILDIIGWSNPKDLCSLTRLISELHLDKNVKILGERKDINSILHTYQIGLMCSKCEGFGRVTVEYMYSGLGVIAADTGASPELVKDGISGLVYHRDDAKDLANRIITLYQKPLLLESLGRTAHKEAKEQFSSNKNYEEIVEVYKKVISVNGQEIV